MNKQTNERITILFICSFFHRKMPCLFIRLYENQIFFFMKMLDYMKYCHLFYESEVICCVCKNKLALLIIHKQKWFSQGMEYAWLYVWKWTVCINLSENFNRFHFYLSFFNLLLRLKNHKRLWFSFIFISFFIVVCRINKGRKVANNFLFCGFYVQWIYNYVEDSFQMYLFHIPCKVILIVKKFENLNWSLFDKNYTCDYSRISMLAVLL